MKAVLVGDERVADQIGVVQEVGVLAAHAEVHDVAVLAREPREEAQRIAPERDVAPHPRDGRREAGAGRIEGCCH